MTNGDAMELPVPSDDRAGRDAALELGPHPQIIVSRTGTLSYANVPARGLFGISRVDFSRPFAELEIASAPVNVLPAFEEALRERRRVELGEHGFQTRGGEHAGSTSPWCRCCPAPGPPTASASCSRT